MPDAYPRASKSIRLGDGSEIPLDDAIEIAKSCPAWPEWCGEGAGKLAECCLTSDQWRGLSSEQAGRWLLSMGDLMELWGRAREIAGKIGAGTGRPNYQSEIWDEIKKRLPLREEILEHLKKGTHHAKARPATSTTQAKTRHKRFPPATYKQVEEAMQKVSAAVKVGEVPPDENEFHRRASILLKRQKLSVPWKHLRPIYRAHYGRRQLQKD
jgi:hypothetical protein